MVPSPQRNAAVPPVKLAVSAIFSAFFSGLLVGNRANFLEIPPASPAASLLPRRWLHPAFQPGYRISTSAHSRAPSFILAWKQWETCGEMVISEVAEPPALQLESRNTSTFKPLGSWP